MSSKKVALLGPEGTFSEEAALKVYPDTTRVFCDTIEGVFETVLKGNAKYGVVPVENSLEGSVAVTLDLLLKTSATICREIVLDINHCLLALPGTRIKDVKEVVSHPHALAQCRGYLKSLTGIKTRNFP
ncbi:MAG: prephenate dehydratase, partial [Candidatus Hydrothermarchaeales archaeon]